ncbi:MAG: hypothetical protein E7583_09865 [Ruminococcaceae bacterium]|nr:hypothetical protein [Oscillospiraceae bacterium]
MKTVNVKVDAEKVIGRIKPMHGIGQPPITGLSNSMFHYLKEAGIPYSRLHDVGGWMGSGLYVDIPNLFPDFDADEDDPASYDFAYTDKIIEGLVNVGCEPYFRLGVTIENAHMVKAHRIFPPKDFGKWAKVCEHVIRHYREGWANGYSFDITYWEIWNEPDDCYTNEMAAMWKGTPEQYYELYSVTAKHLKSCFGDSIKIGGYGHCGVYEYAKDKDLEGFSEDTYIYDFTISFMHDFFKYQQKTGAPIDFFSWHVYDNCHASTREDFKVIAEHADYCRRILDKYGYTNAEHHLNEWNLHTKVKERDSIIASSKTLAFMLMMQNTSTDIMCFYDGGLGYSPYRALINPDNATPYRAYYALMSFNSLYTLKNQVYATSDDNDLFVGAARSGRRALIVMSNPTDEDVAIELTLVGIPQGFCEIHRLDYTYRYAKTGETLDGGRLVIPAYGCVEISVFDID